MNPKRSKLLLSGLVVALPVAGGLFAGTGCKPKAVRGGPGTENPRLDEGAMSTGLDRVDLKYMADGNLEKLFASAAWNDWRTRDKPPVVAIWPIKNETTQHLDDQMNTLLSDIETELINSGIVAVVSRERQAEMVQEVNTQQSIAYDPAEAARIGRQIGADFMITGKLQAVDERMSGERRVQYSLFMQVIDVESSIIRFQTKTERSKAIVR